MEAGGAVADAWREHWGRLLALLAGRFRRLDLAEDALATAFARAAERWPVDGVPDNPPAWLLTVARRLVLDALRSEETRREKQPLLAVDERTRVRAALDDEAPPTGALRDDRLRLVLCCCHPALAPEAQAALTLRLVLGVPTREIAQLFLVQESTMAARLTRARTKLARAAVPFGLPPAEELDERVEVAARVVYLAFTTGYAPGEGDDVLRADVAGEALRLGRLLDELLPGRDVLRALLALLVLQHARRDARVAADGSLVRLADQDRSRWRREEIEAGLRLVLGVRPGSGYAEELRLQATIAGVHATSRSADETDWPAIAGLYADLEALTGSPVVRMNRAVAVAEASPGPDGARVGLALLDGLDAVLPRSHRVPALRAELLVRTGRAEDTEAAVVDWDRAIALCDNGAERAHLAERRNLLGERRNLGPDPA